MTAADEPTPPSLPERAIDARDAADRARLLRELAEIEPEQRAATMSLLIEMEQFRQQVSNEPMPAGLEQALLEIPRTMPRPRFNWREIANRPVGWQHLAACLAIAIGLAVYFNWHTEPAPIRALDPQTAAQVSAIVLESEASAVTNSAADPKALLANWQTQGMAFTPQILQPRPPLQFAGGGTVSVGGKPAVFTRWKADRARYTLYQFDGQCLGLPAEFLATNVDVRRPKTQVTLWPGADGKCGWALVAVDAPAGNPFAGGY